MKLETYLYGLLVIGCAAVAFSSWQVACISGVLWTFGFIWWGEE